MISPITAVEVIPLATPHELADDLDGTVETVLVRLTDAEGRTGIGEADAPPDVVKAFIARCRASTSGARTRSRC
jgi:hypothetical protein